MMLPVFFMKNDYEKRQEKMQKEAEKLDFRPVFVDTEYRSSFVER